MSINKIINKTKKIFKQIQRTSKQMYKKFRFQILLWIYLCIEKMGKIAQQIKFQSRNILRWLLFLISICVAILVYILLSRYCVDNQSISNWFVAVGGMIGGIIAIVFSLISFLQQSAEDLQSSSFYENYLHSGRDKGIFFFLVLIVIQLVSSSLLSSTYSSLVWFTNILASLDIILICLSLILIDALHESASKKVNPNYAIDYLKDESIKQLKKIDRQARSLVYILSTSTDLSKKEAESLIYSRVEKGSFVEFSQLLTSLIEITRQLESRNKQIAVRKAIDAITEILLYYLKLRSGNSTIGMASEVLFAFESDSETFFMSFLEEINRFETFLIKNNDEPSAVKIIKMYESLITTSFKIKYTNGDPFHGNPIAQQLTGYFKNQLQEAAKLNNLECVFQSTNVLNNLMILSSKQDDQLILPLLLDGLDTAMYWGYANQQQIIIERGIKALIYTNNSLLYAEYFKCEMYLDDVLKNLFRNIRFIQRVDSRSIYDLTLIQIFTYWLPETVNGAIKRYLANEHIEIANLLIFFEEFAHQVREYAQNTVTEDSHLFFSIGEFLTNLNELICSLRDKTQDNQIIKNIDDTLMEYVQLAPWFMSQKTKFDLENYRTLFNATTIIGVKELEEDQTNITLVESVVRALMNLLDKVLATEKSYGFDEPRATLFLSYIGILALKKGKTEIFKTIKSYLVKYGNDYNEKYKEDIAKVTGLNDIMVISEIWKWRDDLINLRSRSLLHDELTRLISVGVDEEDIDTFVFAVWEACDDRCSLKTEHQKIINKQSKK